jgi:D-alanine transaminase
MAPPLPICYLNGKQLPVEEARISPFDRGFLYADGAYEVMPVYAGRPFRFQAHRERMTRSLGEIFMRDPHTPEEWHAILGSLVTANGGGDQYIYWQVTRGAENGRNHAPLPDIPRTVFAFCAPLPVWPASVVEKGVACVTTNDTRWARCDIKSISLLANILLRQISAEVNAADTIMLRDGDLMEASASAVHVVINGEIRTPPRSNKILPGTTRSVMEEMATRAEIPFRSTRVTEQELRTADEVWITSSTREVQPVTLLDNHPVGTGKPGPLWRRVHNEFQTYKRELTGTPW